MKTLFIIAGSNGAIGKAYLDHLTSEGNRCIAIARGKHLYSWPNTTTLSGDLLDRRRSEEIINSIDLTGIDHVVLIHTVGKFNFELSLGSDSKDVWESNVVTFQNLADPLLLRTRELGISVKFVALGSPSDPYHVPFWQLFTEAKDAVRAAIKRHALNHSKVQGLVVNISSTKTANEEKLRPFADTSSWLTPEEVVQNSIKDISKSDGPLYQEIQVIKPNPNFNNYYADTDAIYKKWMYEMYGNKED